MGIADHPARPVSLLLPIVLFGTCALLVGCENVEWNWDRYRWEKPRRVVRPSHEPAAPPAAVSRAPPPEAVRSPDETRAAVPVEPESQGRHITDTTRAFYHLYLFSGAREGEHPRGESQVVLKHVDALCCARVLEALYVPLGRSGSPEESYLIYEEKGEFERASLVAPELDVRPEMGLGGAGAPPFAAAVAGFLHLIKQEGVVASASLVSEAERLLETAGQDARCTALQRWAASILAARVAAEHRFDYAAALGHLAVARSHAASESIEQMTAEWWQADSLTQYGKTEEAREAYEELLDRYENRWPNSQVVGRSRAILKERRTR